MIKLKRPRGFEASKNTETVIISGFEYEIANLLKSGIVNQSIVLIAVGEAWHEIEVLNHGADNSNLQDFVNHVETHRLTLADFGIQTTTNRENTDYNLKHNDYMALSDRFPKFSYIQIAKLDQYYKDTGQRTGIYVITTDLQMLSNRDDTVEDWIEWNKKTIESYKNNHKPNFVKMENKFKTRLQQLKDLNMVPNYSKPEEPPFYVGRGFTVSYQSTTEDSDEDWNALIARIAAAPETTAAPVETPAETAAPVNNAQSFADKVSARMDQVINLGLKYDGQTTLQGHGFFVDLLDIKTYDDSKWEELIGKINEVLLQDKTATLQGENGQPAPVLEKTETIEPVAILPAVPETEAPKTKSIITLDTIGKLGPERIAELQGLKEKQDAVVVANPFVKITDTKTLKAAKSAKAALLKASTDTEKIETNASSYLNTFKAMIKKVIEPMAKITRDAHKKQADEITAWENAEALRVQAEQKAKLLKIQERTKKLFAVPFNFNGTVYTIGTLVVMPSQVETATDEEFAAFITQGEEIKKQQDADAEANKSKDDLIREMREKLAALTGETITAAPAANIPNATAAQAFEAPEAETESTGTQIQGQSGTTAGNFGPAAPADDTQKLAVTRFIPSMDYVMPSADNKLLNAFDLAHMEFISMDPIPPAFVKCRAYLIEGMRMVAAEFDYIMDDANAINDASGAPIKKSVRISELCASLNAAK